MNLQHTQSRNFHFLCIVRIITMDTEDKERLAMTGKTSKEACAARLAAAIASTSINKADLAKQIGLGAPSLTNQTKGAQFPSRTVMVYLYKEHRIDFNFILAGSYNQLPAEVQEKLFHCLADAKRSGDTKAS